MNQPLITTYCKPVESGPYFTDSCSLSSQISMFCSLCADILNYCAGFTCSYLLAENIVCVCVCVCHLLIIYSGCCRNIMIACASEVILSRQSKRPDIVTWWGKCKPAIEQRSIIGSGGFLMMFVKGIITQKLKRLRVQRRVLSTRSSCLCKAL